jgi:DNA-binding NarL/FixJ family response regulator
MIQIVIFDNNALFREAVKLAFENIPDISITGDAGDENDFFGLLDRAPVHLVLMGINHPDDFAFGTMAQRLKRDYPNVRVLAVASNDTHDAVEEMMQEGINGYIGKRKAGRMELENAIRKVAAGEQYIGTIDKYPLIVVNDK